MKITSELKIIAAAVAIVIVVLTWWKGVRWIQDALLLVGWDSRATVDRNLYRLPNVIDGNWVYDHLGTGFPKLISGTAVTGTATGDSTPEEMPDVFYQVNPIDYDGYAV